jgi:hypothetical protein
MPITLRISVRNQKDRRKRDLGGGGGEEEKEVGDSGDG